MKNPLKQILLLLACMIPFSAVKADQPPIQKASQLCVQGLFADAYDLLKPWLLDKNNTTPQNEGIVILAIGTAVPCLESLNRHAELDALLEGIVDINQDHPRVLSEVAKLYLRRLTHHGYLIDDQFQRGGRGGGKSVQTHERDRARALQLLTQAASVAMKANDPDKKRMGQIFFDLAECLMRDARWENSWKMQMLTDLSTLPDYEENRYYGGNASRAPVDRDGNPVLYHVPESWESAQNDGERWRWALEQAVKYDATFLGASLNARAEFSQSQFGEQTLQQFSFFRQPNLDPVARTASILSLETLGDDEVIANLATGIKRFNLPEEHHYIALYKKRVTLEQGDESALALEALANIYTDRRQFEKAAEGYRTLLKNFAHMNSKDRWQEKLDQIEKNWGRFEPTGSKVAGLNAVLRYVFRNGRSVKFTAHEIKIDTLIADIKAYLKSKPKNLDWQQIQIQDIGRRLLFDDDEKTGLAEQTREKYLGEKVADWSVDLEPAEKHFDRQTTIAVPIEKAGAYLVAAEMQDGNTEYIVLWLNDTVIVRKQLDNAQLYFVANAATGKPVAGAELTHFGYKQEWKAEETGGRRRKANEPTWTFMEEKSVTDENGLFAFKKDQNQLQNFSWLVTSGAQSPHPSPLPEGEGTGAAFLGFQNIWFSERYDEDYHQVKDFVITDRPVYRPGDKVEIKIWRADARYDLTEQNRLADQNVSYTYTILDPNREVVVLDHPITLDNYGGFVATFELPEDAPLGVYRVGLNSRVPISSHLYDSDGIFRVEEYKKPEYEVIVDAPKEPVKLGDKINATIKAKYYFGSPVTEATVKYKVMRQSANETWFPRAPWDWFYGPGYGWFAYDTPWLRGWNAWGTARPAPPWFPQRYSVPEIVAENEVRIGEDGTVKVEIDTSIAQAMFPGESQRYTITAEVVDNSRRTIVGTGNILVSETPFKVYAWVNRGYYAPGQKIEAGFQARRLDGKPVSGDGGVKIYRITYKEPGMERGAMSGLEAVETEIHSAKITFDESGSATLSLNAAEPGQYRISATLDGQEGGYVFNVHETQNPLSTFREGTSANDTPSPTLPRKRERGMLSWKFNTLELVPEKAEYAPGENVSLRVNSDRKDAFVLLFVKPTNGVCLPPQIVKQTGQSQTVEIPVTQKDMPNFFVEALLVSDGEVVTEMREIAVPPEKRILNVDIKPSAETYKPGEKAAATLLVTDLDGKPVTNSQLVVSIYDKSVEYIWNQHGGGSNVPDIKEFFWKWRRHHHPQTESSIVAYSHNMPEPGRAEMRQLGIFGNIDIRLSSTGGMGGFGRAMKGNMAVMNADVVRTEAVPVPESPMMMVKQEMAMESVMLDQGSMNMETGGAGSNLVEPTVRSNFADTALWIGALETDENGVATIELDMPESLTTWKINVWSLAPGTRVGHGTTEVITRKDLILRMQMPRFLVEKDKVTLSANVHNYLESEKEVKVSIDLSNSSSNNTPPTLTLPRRERGMPNDSVAASQPAEQTVKIPAGGEARIDWEVVAQSPGEATITMKALTDEESDAMQLSLPVYVHGMLKQEAWSAYMAPNVESQTIDIKIPEERKPEQTKLTVRFSPTLAGSMIDALPYLVDYPYGCTEQTLNRFLPTVLVQKILQDMNVDLAKLKELKTNLNAQELGEGREPAIARVLARRGVNPVYDTETVQKMVKDGVTTLTNMQCSDGGWGWFGGNGERSSAHLTALVVHGLQLAQQNDVAVDDNVIRRGIAWLQKYQDEQLQWLENAALSENERKNNRWKSAADNVDAFVMMVLWENVDPRIPLEMPVSTHFMQEFLRRDRAKLSPYGIAMLGIVETTRIGNPDEAKFCVKMLEQYLVQDEENQTAWLNLGGSGNWQWWCWHGSEFETQAYYLKLLMRTDPKSPVAPRLVKYLLNNRRHATYWNSTRDTAIVIEAFAEFLKATGENAPNMTVEVLVDGDVKKNVEITPENLFEIDNTLVLAGDEVASGKHTIELRKKGEGPLYINAYLENFTLEDPIEKTGLEVKIERKIYKLVRDEAVTTQSAGGRGQVVDLKVEKFSRVPIDPHPNPPPQAGEGILKSGDLVEVELIIESKNDYESILIEDMKAAGLEPVDVRGGYTDNELGAYVEFRDEKVAMFVYRLPQGKHSVTYRLRAETPGSFSALPAKISAMYAPELKGNSDENKVHVTESMTGH